MLDNGEVVEIDTTTADGIDGRFYVQVVDGDVDAEGFATVAPDVCARSRSPCGEIAAQTS